MPWTVDDVDRFRKGLSADQKKTWVKVANGILRECQAKGGKDCEGMAIRVANSKFESTTKDQHIMKKAKLSDRDSLDWRDVVERYDDMFMDIEEDSLDAENRIIKNFCVMGKKESENGYTYTDKAQSTLATLINGSKVFINHPSKSEFKDRDGVRDLKDWAGNLYNGRQDGDKVIADFHVRGSYWPLVEDIATMKPAKVGGSINSRVRVFTDEEGKESIVDIDKLHSTDLVASAATTQNLWESTKEKVETEMKEIDEAVGEIMKEKFPTWFKEYAENFIEERLAPRDDEDVLEIEDPDGPDIELA
jgi:hypothetical protein